jgi:hypothetical protein
VDRLVAPDFVPHSWPNVGPGPAPLKEAMQRVSAGLSDTTMIIEDMIAEGDKVAVRLTSRARQTGEFMDCPPQESRMRSPRRTFFAWSTVRSLSIGAMPTCLA